VGSNPAGPTMVNRWLPSEYFWSTRIRRIAFRSWLNWLLRNFSGKGERALG
jgi:hypothetical protein